MAAARPSPDGAATRPGGRAESRSRLLPAIIAGGVALGLAAAAVVFFLSRRRRRRRPGDDHRRRERPGHRRLRRVDIRTDIRTDVGPDHHGPDDHGTVTPAMPLRLDDDDDTTPTENSGVIADLTATLVASPLTVAEWGSASSAGVRRRVNEDAWGQRANTFVVADGMGGRGGGALAARTAIDRFLARLDEAGAHPDWRRIVESVNADVIQAGRERGVDRLGTTLLVADRRRPVGHVDPPRRLPRLPPRRPRRPAAPRRADPRPQRAVGTPGGRSRHRRVP